MANKIVDLGNGIQFKVMNRISEGQFADVYKVIRKSDNQFFALKKLRLLEGNLEAVKNLQNELRTLSKLDKTNDHIVKVVYKHETRIDGGSPGDKEVYLVMELCPGKYF